MEAAFPAAACEGARRSASCAQSIVPARHTAQRSSSIAPCSSRCFDFSSGLRVVHAVLVDDDMKVLNLPCQRFRNLESECLRLLRKQSALDIAIGDPYHLAVAIVETGDDMRNIHGLATLIQQLS